MVFSSLTFLCIFLPAVFLLYTVIPNLHVRNGLLIAASLVFYAYGEPVYVLLMIASSLMNYICALFVGSGGLGKRRAVLAVNVVLNLGVLCFFKYTGMAVESINGVFHTGIPVPQIVLPIGISFFTFQAMSYVIDVYRQKVQVQKNYARVLLYISFFPQLIAGPIVKYRDISEEIGNRKQSVEMVVQGLRRFVCGLSKKVLIANTMGAVADAVFQAGSGEVNLLGAWIGAIAYLMQIYYDFSGYSDMAIGLGKMFGFHFQENFQHPYGAVGIQDFWHKWHISLSTWFKEYLYIPLGGNRKGVFRTYLNRLIVFFCTGLWHGANWTFVIWGLFHGMFLILETAVPFPKKIPSWITRIYTLLVVTVGFVMFRADTVGQGIWMIGQMFSGFRFDAGSMTLAVQQLTPWFLVVLAAAVIGAAPIRPLVKKIQAGVLRDAQTVSAGWMAVRICLDILCVLLLAWCIIRLSGSTYNPFIYFRF